MHNDHAEHTCLTVTRDQTNKLQVCYVRKLPVQRRSLCAWDCDRIRIVVLHIRMPSHPFLMLGDLIKGSQKKLMIDRP